METVEENHNNNLDIFEKKISVNEIASRTNNELESYGINIECVENIGDEFPANLQDNTLIGTNHVEEPMDLTFSQRNIKTELQNAQNNTHLSTGQVINGFQLGSPIITANILQDDNHLVANLNLPKKRGRKRKEVTIEINNGVSCTPSYDNPDFVQMDSRQGEVLMAAKSLFSKRTRTLYHWMYPNTPKAQLKSAISMSWETLGVQEKEFYISQVLGRFGFPQSSLMINPQLGGLRGVPVLPPLDLSTPVQLSLETHNAVSTILNDRDSIDESGAPWSHYNYANIKKIAKKRGKIGRPPGSKVQKLKEATVTPVTVENINEDFQDDPELRKEFEQFKWTLDMTNK